MLEPAVTLTDYALAIECGVFAALLSRIRSGVDSRRVWYMAFFASLAVASLSGGTSHGFFPDKGSLAHAVIWDTTLLAIGLTGLAAWMIGAEIIASPTAARALRLAAAAGFVAYAGTVVLVTDRFAAAVVFYLPPTLFLLVLFCRRSRRAHYRLGAAGLALTLCAAGVQQTGVGLPPLQVDHNTLYHLMQAVALALLFLGARGVITDPGGGSADS